MSKTQDYISNRCAKDIEFATEIRKESLRLEMGLALLKHRENIGLSQQKFALLVGKPCSIIAKIESGAMNTSISLLNEIALASHSNFDIKFSRNRQ
ncbi:helix-turn-helix domain-containing protein [Companilactobacillus mishanensis]|uniref:Helix-turn-helix domain-containing protein n=1 Tax=Companilactobacillus mishanensis TaxID=2486008 RepID=A0ABW9P7F7_9LACO|nr:helix-turn-helix domain-containing protein [Companilactobacillus mishanensis]MQS45210.1 helix-turn-helix domain-containing protein [Companilactobacillus mishanensis]